jgi:hypothetical protein
MQEKQTTNTLILSIYRELAEAFIEPLQSAQESALILGDHKVTFDIFSGDPSQDPTFEEHVAKANAIAIIVRFLDVLSLDKIKMIYRHLPNEISVPIAIFLLRDKGEADFKISCPSCGQKLWLRDADIGKRGRCPNCKKPFVILSQADHLKSQLMLPESVPIIKLVRTDTESFKLAMAQLLASLSIGIKPTTAPEMTAEALKNATVRVQVQEN